LSSPSIPIRQSHSSVIERQIGNRWASQSSDARDQRGERDDAAIAWREASALPHFAEKTVLRVFIKRCKHPCVSRLSFDCLEQALL
jgi:hypothetical protein